MHQPGGGSVAPIQWWVCPNTSRGTGQWRTAGTNRDGSKRVAGVFFQLELRTFTGFVTAEGRWWSAKGP